MLKQSMKSLALMLLTFLLFAAGAARADNRVAPTAVTNWPRLHGAAATKQTAVFGSRVNSNSYNFLGQSVITAQRAGAFFNLVPSTGVTTATTFSDATTLNFDINAGRILTNGNYILVGVKTVGATETRGSIFIRTSTGAAVANLQTFGTVNTGSRFNNVIELTGSLYNGKLAMVGFTTQTGNAGAGDVYYARASVSGSTITSDFTGMIGTANEDEGYAICQVTDSTIAIAGRSKTGSNNDIYVKLIKISDGSAVGGFTLSGAAGTGNDDAIRDIFKDGAGNLVLVGSSGTTTGRKGYLAKISPTTGTLVAGYEFTTTDTDVELYDADLMANGNIVATGRKGNDLFLIEIQDNGSAFVMDWSNSYDSGRTGDIGRYVKVQADSTILVAGLANDASASVDAVYWLFNIPALQSNAGPTAFNLTSPADSTVVSTQSPTLNWEASTDTLLGYTVHYELTYADNSGFTSPAVIPNIATNSYTVDSVLALETTYYWKVIAQDGTGYETACTQSPDGWRFITPANPPDPLHITLNTDVASTIPYYDNTNIAGFDVLASDTFDTYDVPEPPLLGDNYIQTYFYESGFTGFRQKLSTNYRTLTGKNLDTCAYVFTIQTKTDQADSVTYTFDISTNNTDSLPVIFWNGTDYQSLLGASDATNVYKYLAAGSTGSPETVTFAVLVGDKTAPVVTPVLPAADSTTEIPRSSTTTLAVSVDNTCPVRHTTIAFSPEPDSTGSTPNDPRANFTDLNNMPVVPATPDDPTNGIVNANLTYDWVPYTDDWALFSAAPTRVLNQAQLRFITEDWAGNIDTTYACFKLVPDAFNFTGDYIAGWHLLSIPLTPDASLPSDIFTTHTGNDSGIAGGFNVFSYSLGGGYVQPTSMSIGKGYFMALNQDNTSAASNSGLGTVKGTIAKATANVDLALDAGAPNLIGVSVRNTDLGSNHLQADDWLFSDDNFTNSYTWTEATTTADKGGDASIWIDPTSLVGFDADAGDYTTTILGTASLVPGQGYVLLTGSSYVGTLKMRTRRDSSAVDKGLFNSPVVHGRNYSRLDEYNGDWMVPITMALGTMHNMLSGFGCRNGATAGWDNGVDVTAPPLPPSGNYVRAIIDGHSWNSPFGSLFVTDIRAPYSPERMSDSWDFNVNASESGTVSMTFDLDALVQYCVPAGYQVTAIVGDQTFDVNANHTITFAYTTGQPLVVHVVATFSTLSATSNLDPTMPTEYSIVSSYPNPFNPTTTIRIALPETSTLKVIVYNTLGEQVMTLVDGRVAAGYHNINFDARSLSSGMYFISAKVDGKMNQLKRVVLLR